MPCELGTVPRFQNAFPRCKAKLIVCLKSSEARGFGLMVYTNPVLWQSITNVFDY